MIKRSRETKNYWKEVQELKEWIAQDKKDQERKEIRKRVEEKMRIEEFRGLEQISIK